MITDSETWALSLITSSASNTQTELNRILAARAALITLLEDKYKAKFNTVTGEFEAIKEPPMDEVVTEEK